MLQVHNLTHVYNSLTVLREINLRVEQGEIVCILGPSGCGKTTLLRLIAGLEPVRSGDIRLHGRSIITMPVHSRRFGLMFQEFALFPHMNVEENVRFGLHMAQMPAEDQRARLDEVMALVSMTGMEKRKIDQLSGGERQRVALARSLAPEPQLLMLDEPLGSLDAALKGQLAMDLRRIIKHTQTTSLYVTHDQHEAFSIADRVVVMRQGEIEQIAEPETLYLQPATRFVAGFLELENVFAIERFDGAMIHTVLGTIPYPHRQPPPGYFLLHPDTLELGLEQPARGDNTIHVLSAVVEDVVYVGDTYRVWLSMQKQNQAVRILAKAPALGVKPTRGQSVWLTFDPADVIYLEA